MKLHYLLISGLMSLSSFAATNLLVDSEERLVMMPFVECEGCDCVEGSFVFTEPAEFVGEGALANCTLNITDGNCELDDAQTCWMTDPNGPCKVTWSFDYTNTVRQTCYLDGWDNPGTNCKAPAVPHTVTLTDREIECNGYFSWVIIFYDPGTTPKKTVATVTIDGQCTVCDEV